MCESIRIIPGELISDTVCALYEKACKSPDPGVESILRRALENEIPGPGMEALKIELRNFEAAAETGLPLCQDTGTVVVFIELGNRVCIDRGILSDLVDEGVRRACRAAYLRPSQVDLPLSDRINTCGNSPGAHPRNRHQDLTAGKGRRM